MSDDTAIAPALRWRALARDGCRCLACGVRGGDAALVVAVGPPLAPDAPLTVDDLMTLCAPCAAGRRAAPLPPDADADLRQEALARVLGWLAAAWADESKAAWSLEEGQLLGVLSQAHDYAEAERVVRGVATRYRHGALIPDITRVQVGALLVMLSEWLNTSRHRTTMHGAPYTAEEGAADRRRFWQESWTTRGLLARYPDVEER